MIIKTMKVGMVASVVGEIGAQISDEGGFEFPNVVVGTNNRTLNYTPHCFVL